MEFLDCLLFKGPRFRQNGILDLKPFFKSTNTFQYLHYNSCHPLSTFRAVVKGETVRILRACTDRNTFDRVKNKLLHHFVARGYPRSLVRKAFSEVPFDRRATLLRDNAPHSGQICAPDNSAQNSPASPGNASQIISFITKYNPRINKRDLSYAFQTTQEESDFPRVRFVFVKNKTVANYVVRAGAGSVNGSLSQSQAPPVEPIRLLPFSMASNSSLPCKKRLCVCCRFMSVKNNIISNTNAKSFRLPSDTDCSSTNVIYCMECKLCPNRNQYIGQTRHTLRARMGGHRAAFSNGKNLPLYKHFRKRGHTLDNACVSILEVTEPEQLLQREAHWIAVMDTKFPKGLNSMYED